MAQRWQHIRIGVLAAVLSAWPISALAIEWALETERSAVAFEYQANGKPAQGVFARFSGEGTFSPDAPEAATLELRIESASIDLNDALASAFATSAEWFDSATHPLLIYDLTALTPLGGDSYEARGLLTIRGRTRPISSTITLVVDEDSAHAEGTLEIDRKDYGLGIGPSALFVDIGRAVAVQFDLTARPAR